jgi:hypothetical protein
LSGCVCGHRGGNQCGQAGGVGFYRLRDVPKKGSKGFCAARRKTADLSTTLRSGRDDKFVGGLDSAFPGKVRGTADPSTARRDRSASLLMTKGRVGVSVGIGLRDPRSQKRDLGHPSISPFECCRGFKLCRFSPDSLSASRAAPTARRGWRDAKKESAGSPICDCIGGFQSRRMRRAMSTV